MPICRTEEFRAQGVVSIKKGMIDPDHSVQSASFCRGEINRVDFGVMWGSDPIPGGGMMTGKKVEITLDVEADLPEEKQGRD